MMERSIDVKTRHYPQGNDNTKGMKKSKAESNLEEENVL
jgi:hypothetical protein